jgi:hypothetical protein
MVEKFEEMLGDIVKGCFEKAQNSRGLGGTLSSSMVLQQFHCLLLASLSILATCGLASCLSELVSYASESESNGLVLKLIPSQICQRRSIQRNSIPTC